MTKRTEWLTLDLEHRWWCPKRGRFFLCDGQLRVWAVLPKDTKRLRACFSACKPTSDDDWVMMRTSRLEDASAPWVLVYLSAPDAPKSSRGEHVLTSATFDQWLVSAGLDNATKVYAWLELES